MSESKSQALQCLMLKVENSILSTEVSIHKSSDTVPSVWYQSQKLNVDTEVSIHKSSDTVPSVWYWSQELDCRVLWCLFICYWKLRLDAECWEAYYLKSYLPLTFPASPSVKHIRVSMHIIIKFLKVPNFILHWLDTP